MYSYLHLQTIPTGLLRSLVQLTKQPPIKDAPISDEAYGPLEPFLRLFLPQNLLRSVPGEIFELQGLKVLSLRHNKLTEIPCAIRKLSLLQNLNVAGNRLEHLPWEIVGLMQKGDLQQLTVHPNPFISLEHSNVAQWHSIHNDKLTYRERSETSTPGSPAAKAPIHVATGAVIYLNTEGNALDSTAHVSSNFSFTSQQQIPSPHAHSLRELALQSCNRSHQLSRILEAPGLLDSLPAHVLHLLDRAKEVRDFGGRYCSVCCRSYVIPRVEWIEWWDCMPYENGSKKPRRDGEQLHPLPFLRRGCSWSCRPVG